MTWRVGTQIPKNIYDDSRAPDRQDIGRMDSAEDAALVVKAVNAHTHTVDGGALGYVGVHKDRLAKLEAVAEAARKTIAMEHHPQECAGPFGVTLPTYACGCNSAWLEEALAALGEP